MKSLTILLSLSEYVNVSDDVMSQLNLKYTSYSNINSENTSTKNELNLCMSYKSFKTALGNTF